MAKLSVVINTKNAEGTLEQTLKSVKWADEIVVMDMHSDDDTVKISKKYTNKVHQHKDVGYVEPARNAALAKATGDWVLIVDSDEEIPTELKERIRNLIDGDATAEAYWLPRKNMVFGLWIQHAGWWPDYQLRLFKKGVVKWPSKIHGQPQVKGEVDRLAPTEDLAILHHNYTNVEDFVNRLNRYTTHEVANREQPIINAEGVIGAFSHELLSRLFKQRGIDGGLHGVSISFLQSFYELLVMVKQWQKDGFKPRAHEQKSTIRALRSFQQDLNYWIADWHVKRSWGLGKLWWMMRRRFRI